MATARARYAIVGTGARAEMFIRSLAVDHAGTAEVVAFADTNPVARSEPDRHSRTNQYATRCRYPQRQRVHDE